MRKGNNNKNISLKIPNSRQHEAVRLSRRSSSSVCGNNSGLEILKYTHTEMLNYT